MDDLVEHMTPAKELWLETLEATHAAVCAYSRVYVEARARGLAHRLQRLPATGICGSDHGFKTLWEEYCHDIQDGPVNALAWAWDSVILLLIQDAIGGMPRTEVVLISIYATWELDGPVIIDAAWPDGIQQVLRDQLAFYAAGRNLRRFEKG